jgi:XTP/dITP diphosphohydrolase
MATSHDNLASLIATMATLRGPDGCVWDAKQTHTSLITHLVEEVFELIEAVESGSRPDIKEELGDVLYQVLFHADIASDDTVDPFDIDDVARMVEQKMRARHPHVFADRDASTVAEVVALWDDIKAEQKSHRESTLEGIPGKLSALARAASVLKRAGDLVDLEVGEEFSALESEEELGHQLLALVVVARRLGLDPERALRERIRAVEDQVRHAEATRSERGQREKGEK